MNFNYYTNLIREICNISPEVLVDCWNWNTPKSYGNITSSNVDMFARCIIRAIKYAVKNRILIQSDNFNLEVYAPYTDSHYLNNSTYTIFNIEFDFVMDGETGSIRNVINIDYEISPIYSFNISNDIIMLLCNKILAGLNDADRSYLLLNNVDIDNFFSTDLIKRLDDVVSAIKGTNF